MSGYVHFSWFVHMLNLSTFIISSPVFLKFRRIITAFIATSVSTYLIPVELLDIFDFEPVV